MSNELFTVYVEDVEHLGSGFEEVWTVLGIIARKRSLAHNRPTAKRVLGIPVRDLGAVAGFYGETP